MTKLEELKAARDAYVAREAVYDAYDAARDAAFTTYAAAKVITDAARAADRESGAAYDAYKAELEGARKAQLLDKIEDAMWDVLDEGSFGRGVSAGDLVTHLATVALNAVESELKKTKEQTND